MSSAKIPSEHPESLYKAGVIYMLSDLASKLYRPTI